MCGIGGGIDFTATSSKPELYGCALKMLPALAHRGPDSKGSFVDPALGVFLAHTRLAVLDLSEAGNQPMTGRSGRFILVFNGEIYNHLELREELLGPFAGTSDTETLLAAVEQWGLCQTLRRLDGMFAFALLDTVERELHLVRDRLGEKPLYVGSTGSRLVFASELRALRSAGWVGEALDRRAMGDYLRYGFVPGPASIYADVQKLAPGHLMTVQLGVRERPVRQTQCYWSLADLLPASPLAVTLPEAVQLVETILFQSVKRRLIADVPLGIFLSSGLDSAVVAAVSARIGNVSTFTASFPGSGLDEASAASATARALGLRNELVHIGIDEALSTVSDLGQVYDEPFADPSQLPTLLLCRATRQRVTVALSGDGADEVFGGYRRYSVAGPNWERYWWSVPKQARLLLARAILGGRSHPPQRLAERLGKAADVLASADSWDAYLRLAETWRADTLPTARQAFSGQAETPVQRMLLEDLARTLPDQMFCKVDRAAMSCGLEVRMPLAAPALVEAVWKLPLDLHVGQPGTKFLLRTVAKRLLPEHVLARPKRGFDPPLATWLAGPLRDWTENLLADPVVAELPLPPGAVDRIWSAHLSGVHSHTNRLWSVLMYVTWWRAQHLSVRTPA